MKKNILVLSLFVILVSSNFQSLTSGYFDDNSNVDIIKNKIKTTTEVIIYNPYDEVDFELTNHYKANLHTHTTESDGSSSPSEVIYHYHNNGSYDILSITDHNKNTWPWSNWISETPLIQSESSEYYQELGMLAISGNEMSYGHHRGSFLNDYSYSGIFLKFSFWYIKRQNGLSIFHHPGRYNFEDDWYNKFFDNYNDLILGIEVYNQGDRYQDDRLLWDRLNSERFPNDLIWGFSNDDMHHIISHSFRNYQYLLMNNLSEEEFRDSLINGEFYFSYEPNGSIRQNSNYGLAMTPKLIDVIINENFIELKDYDANRIEWYDDNSQIVSTDFIINVSDIDSNFVRAVLVNEYGFSYTQPFGLEKS